eukprot:jgi/Chrzof1/2883/Cz12g02210.t1
MDAESGRGMFLHKQQQSQVTTVQPLPKLRKHLLVRTLAVAVLSSLAIGIVFLDPPPQLLAECIHALGGGLVGPQGDLRPTSPAYCSDQLKSYVQPGGAYWQEVQLAANDAMQALNLQAATDTAQQIKPISASTKQMIQVRAAQSTLQSAPPLPSPNASLLVVFDIDETALSNYQVILQALEVGSSTSQAQLWQARTSVAAAPPLKPVLQLYQAVYAAGYSVAFVTGRAETSRPPTVTNLKAAGYGELCPKDYRLNSSSSGSTNTSSSSSSSSSTSRSLQGALHVASQPASPCYIALMMRPHGDLRLASVYKPWARSHLEQMGYTLMGSIGDQFSDINGEHSAPYAFKLPNPFYYIL